MKHTIDYNQDGIYDNMKIEKVKVSSQDEYGPRVVEIKTDKGSFETPNRTVTSTEGNYKKQVRTLDDPFLHPIFESIAHFTDENLQALHMRNGPFAKRKTALSSQVRAYSDLDMITKFYPQMKKGSYVSVEDSRTLADLQRYCGYDLITILDLSLNSPVDKFEKHITKMSEKFIFPFTEAEPMPYVDMAMEHDLFKKKVDAIWDNSGIFKAMGVIFRSPPSYMANYMYLQKNNDRDIWIHTSGVNRYYQKNWTTSQVHIPQLYGIDTVSILSQRIGGEPAPKPVEKIKRYDSKSLGIIEIKKHREKYGVELDCDCPVCLNKNLDNAIEKYTVNHKGEQEISLLDIWFKLHESYSSLKEFEKGRKSIKKNEFDNYLQDKEHISNVINDFKK